MTKYIILFISILIASSSYSQVYLSKSSNIRIFSRTPLEDIEAISKSGSAALSVKTKRLIFKVNMKTMKFPKALMEEHFNENYIESEKYPMAEFDGIIAENIDWTKDTEHDIKVRGNFTLHGVTKEREIHAKIRIKGKKVSGSTKFIVKCSEHSIVIPKLVERNIKNDIEVTINVEMEQRG